MLIYTRRALRYNLPGNREDKIAQAGQWHDLPERIAQAAIERKGAALGPDHLGPGFCDLSDIKLGAAELATERKGKRHVITWRPIDLEACGIEYSGRRSIPEFARVWLPFEFAEELLRENAAGFEVNTAALSLQAYSGPKMAAPAPRRADVYSIQQDRKVEIMGGNHRPGNRAAR